MTASVRNPLITINPNELRFQFELEKQTFCDLRVANNTEHYVAFKVKTISPKKCFVRPNIGVIQPWDSCIIREYNSESTDVDDLPPDTFNKDSGKSIEDLKLRVVYISPTSPKGITEDSQKFDTFSVRSRDLRTRLLNVDVFTHSSEVVYKSGTLQRLKEERDATARQTRQLQQELDMLKRRRNKRSDQGFSFTFVMFVGFIGFLFGLLLKLTLSSSPTESINTV